MVKVVLMSNHMDQFYSIGHLQQHKQTPGMVGAVLNDEV